MPTIRAPIAGKRGPTSLDPMSTVRARPRPRRRSAGWVPNQHGAWAMLAAPLLVGTLAGGPRWAHLLLAAFWFTGYLAFFATAQWLKSGRRDRYLPAVRAYGSGAAVLGLALAFAQPELLRWVPGFVLPLGVGLWTAARRRERELLAGLTTVVASGLIAVVAYDIGASGDLGRGWLLALVQLLYFVGTVFYVKSAIRERDNPAFGRLSTVVHAVATVAMAWLSWCLVLVFAALTLRAALVPGLRPTPKQLGIAEIVSTLVVSVVSLLVV